MGKVQFYTIEPSGEYRPNGQPLFFPDESTETISLLFPLHAVLLDPTAAFYICGAAGRGLKPSKDVDILIVSDVMKKGDYGISLKAGNRLLRFFVKLPFEFEIYRPKVTGDTRPFRFSWFIGRRFIGGSQKTKMIFEKSLVKKFGKHGPEKVLPAKKEMLGAKGERLELLAKLTYLLRKSGFERFLTAPKSKELSSDEIFRVIRVAFFPDSEDRAKDYVKRLLEDKKLSQHLATLQQMQLKDIVEK